MRQVFRLRSILLATGLLISGSPGAAPTDNQAVEGGDGVAGDSSHQHHEHQQQQQQQQPQQHQHGRGPKALILSIGDDAQVELWRPDLTVQPTEIEQGKVIFKGTGVDNYHAIVARRTEGNLKEAAIRYHYARGKPSGHSSTELTAAVKSELEIVPDPIPREHYRYHSDQTWDFILRFNGAPLPGSQVLLKTDHGTEVIATSGADGRVSMHIPDDFPDIVEGERDKRSAEFTVTAEHAEGEQRYRTTLNAFYRVNPQYWQSTTMGIVVAGMGFVAGGFIGGMGRKQRKGKKS